MGKLIATLRRLPTRTTALVAVIAVAVAVPGALLAWGPDRPTHTVENPATNITFNSITNNPDYGDERNFVRIKDASDMGPGNWKDQIDIQEGKEYLVQMYVHNNAATSLNLVAENTRVMANVPNTTGKQVQIDGFISADNATPKQVWDQAIFNSTKDFNLTYVAGSATLYNKVFTNGTAINDSIVTSQGALVGYDKIDGKVPGCFNFSGYVSFKVKPQFPKKDSFDTKKEVRKAGETTWKKDVATKPGDTVEYQLTYKNTGDVRQNNVVVKDILPAGLTYEAGSTYLKNGSHPTPVKVSDNLTTSTGINISDYQPGATAYIKFSAKVASNDKLAVCGPNTLVNKVRTTVNGGYKEDTANVTVSKVCQPGQISVCALATKQIVTINENQFDSSKHSKNVADCAEEVPAELPETGTNGTAMLAGAGIFTAALAYAFTNRRIRNLLIG